MLTAPLSIRVFVASVPVDLRRSFDRLAACTLELLGQDPLSPTATAPAGRETRPGKRNRRWSRGRAGSNGS